MLWKDYIRYYYHFYYHLLRRSSLFMRCGDVINVTVVTRRHVGGILKVNKTKYKKQKK